MSWLEFNSVAYGFSDERVIVEASGALQPGNIVGLVGANGGGKTTLIRLLTGELSPEEGRTQLSRQTKLAYVAQAAPEMTSIPLKEYVRAGRDDLLKLEVRLEELRQELAADSDDPELLDQLGRAEERFAVLGGRTWEAETLRLLNGLGFGREEFAKPLQVMSGGQQQKANLARALLSTANCLIFDEPTNHLDLAAQAFFKDYVKGLPRETGVILVSHDRWLLNALCTHIWELDSGVLYRYTGSYQQYVPQRDQRRRQSREAFQRQQEEIARTEDYIRRNLAGQNTRQAQGRRKLLARMERLDSPANDPEMSFVLQPRLRTGEQLLLVEELAFGYGEDTAAEQAEVQTHTEAAPTGLSLNPPLSMVRSTAREGLLIDELSFSLYRGERLGIVGPNGCGKTTVLKLLARSLSPTNGLIAWGTNSELGIFSQDSSDLVPGRDCLAELRSVEPGINDSEARNYLGRFGFSGDDVYADVRTLSGGEQSRLSLAKIFRRRPNVLLLDEPTNHLDIFAREALEQFLNAYQGSILMVTHDRELLEQVCDRLLVYRHNASGGMDCTFYRGRYSDYLTWLARAEAEAAQPAPARQKSQQRAELTPNTGQPELLSLEDVTQLARAGRVSPAAFCLKQLERLGRKQAELEEAISLHEEQISQLQQEQHEADKGGDYTTLTKLQQEIDIHQLSIEDGFEQLEVLAAEQSAWAGLARQIES